MLHTLPQVPATSDEEMSLWVKSCVFVWKCDDYFSIHKIHPAIPAQEGATAN